MMKIECHRGLVKRTGQIGFKWRAHFTFALKNPTDHITCSSKFGNFLTDLKRLAGVFSLFTNWLELQADYPEEGLICTIEITEGHIDENRNFLAGKILRELKDGYRQVHPKMICQKKEV